MKKLLVSALGLAFTLQLVKGSDLLNYEIIESKRCIGSAKIGETGETAESCALVCNASGECAGFNFVRGGSKNMCVARAAGCTEMEDENSTFYKKKTKQHAHQISSAINEALLLDIVKVADISEESSADSASSTISTSSATSDTIPTTTRLVVTVPVVTDPPTTAETTTETTTEATTTTSTTTLPPSTTTTTIKILSTTTRDFSVDITHDFTHQPGIRCVGGRRIGERSETSTECAAICSKAWDCAGFNVNAETGYCVARSTDCVKVHDPGSVFHIKQGVVLEDPPTLPPRRRPTTEQTTLEASTTTTTEKPQPQLPRFEADANSKLGKFAVLQGTRCAGSRIGEPTSSLEGCAELCLEYSDCVGFNFMKKSGICGARTFDCTETDDDSVIFYKRKNLPPRTKPRTETQTTTPYEYPTETTTILTTRKTRPPTTTAAAVAAPEPYDNRATAAAQSPMTEYIIKQTKPRPTSAPEIYEPPKETKPRQTAPPYVAPYEPPRETKTRPTQPPEIYELPKETKPRQTAPPYVPPYEPPRETRPRPEYYETPKETRTRPTPVPEPYVPAYEPPRETRPRQTLPPEYYETRPPPTRPTTAAPPPGPDGSMMHYVVMTGKRCAGGSRIGESAHLIEKCATICAYASDCVGFNFNEVDCSCVAVSSSCYPVEDSGAIFYKAIGMSTNAPAPAPARPAMPLPVEPTAAGIAGYTIKPRIRCTGGTSMSVGMVDNLEKGADLCKITPDCIGFNYATLTGTCVLRSSGCEEQPASDDISFYKKNL